MHGSFFLQAPTLLCLWMFCLIAPPALSLDLSGGKFTDRQREILRDLEAFHLPGQPAGRGWMLGAWDTDTGLTGLVALPSGGGNAAERFRQLEEYYREEAAELAERGEKSRGVEALLAAADLGECRFSPDYYPEFTSTEVRQPNAEVLRLYLLALLRRGSAALELGDLLEAERCYRAGLVCGWHLTRDRSSSMIYVTGLIFKMRSAQAYGEYLAKLGDGVRLDLARRYAENLGRIMRAFVWKSNVALGEIEAFACLLAAARVALGDAEAFWRKEAVARLAALRYGLVREGAGEVRRYPDWEAIADQVLEEVAGGDPDATVRKFTIWAVRQVKPEGYAGLRQVFTE